MEKSINNKADYASALNEKILSSIVDSYVDNLQNKSRAELGNSKDDVYSSVKNLGYKSDDASTFSTLNLRLKGKSLKTKKAELLQKLLDEYSLEQQIYEKEYIKQQIVDYQLSPTSNSDFMVNNEGKYYKLIDGCFVLQENVLQVNEDGSYIVQTPMKSSNDIIVTTYNKAVKPIAIKIVNKNQRPYQTEVYVAKKLNLKKEYVNKYKLHGYSGNASGFIATIRNLLTKPIPSGCYLHESYNFYKWSLKNLQFEIQLRQGIQPGSPMLSDYDIKEDKVIRTDYDGVGIYI